MKKNFLNWFAIGCLLVVMALVSGCSATSGNFGRLVHDGLVKQNFESFSVIPEYHYYHFGPKSFPEAVVGISKEFTMDSRFWTSINLTSNDLRRWIWSHALRNGDPKQYGSRIVDSQGKQIGVWYSLKDWQQWARIEIIDETVVKIGSPVNQHTRMPFETINRK